MNGRTTIAVVILIASAVLIFARLGHYPLWDDEAITALAAEGVLRTGDTTAVLDRNFVAYGGGILLKNNHDRSTPPLPAYLTAPSLALFGRTSFAARLPFALLGVACVALMLRWLHLERADVVTWALTSAAIIGNVSLMLYFRNCRYYGVAIVCSVAIAYLYLHRQGRRREFLLAAAASIALLASNYLNFIALYLCLAIDYLIWGRRERPIGWKNWAVLLVPQIVVGAIIVSIWNPFFTSNSAAFWTGGLGARAIVFLRAWRDINGCEYGALPLLLLAPLLYFVFRDRWLVRASLALLAYMIVMALLAPTNTSRSQYADVRYLTPIIPLCIAIEVLVIRHLWSRWRIAAAMIAVLAFATNVLHLGMFRSEGLRSTIVAYVGELVSPPRDPYSVTIAWIKGNVRAGETIAVLPNHMTYPLMFHAPHARYIWQFKPWQEGAADDLIVFGPTIQSVMRSGILARDGWSYEPFERLETYWQDRYRPELMFRLFKNVESYDPRGQDIYIFKARRSSTPPAGTTSTSPAPSSPADK
jgi:4-amino-4-deoxy-L-arabinose transferase-like glycosyltransferase